MQAFHECKFLIRRNAVWNNLMVEKTLCKGVDHSFGRSTVYSEGKSISRVAVYSSKNKTLSLPWWKQSNKIKMPPDNWHYSGDHSGE